MRKSIFIFLFVTYPLISFGQSSLLNNLVAYWTFQTPADLPPPYAPDKIGDNDGTLFGPQNVLTVSPIPPNYSMYFETGGTDYISLPDAADLQMYTSSFSMSAWVYPSEFGASWKGIVGGETGSFVFGTYGVSGNVSAAKNQIAGAPSSGLNLVMSSWNHVLITFNSSATTNNLKYYVNGVSSTVTFNYDFDINAASNFIGKIVTGNEWRGYIDEVAVWKRELTAAEADTLFNGPDGIGEEGYYWPFIEGGAGPPSTLSKYVLLKGKTRGVLLDGIQRNWGGGIAEEPQTFDGGYDSTDVLAITQKFLIPENVVNGDYVGRWLPTFTWMSIGAKSYTIENDPISAFAINSSSGLITISDATKVNGKIIVHDTLVKLLIRTTDAVIGYEIDTARIWIRENSFCKFYDFSGSNGSGTRASPYNDMDAIGFQIGYGYFMKRGTETNNESTTLANFHATTTNPILFGAYGSGNKPCFDGNNAQIQCFYIGIDNQSTYSTNIYFYDLNIRRYNQSVVYTKRPSYGIGLYNCDINNNVNSATYAEAVIVFNTTNYADSLTSWPYEIINCVFDTSNYSSSDNSFLKMGGSPSVVRNCKFKGSTTTSLRFSGGGHGDKIEHVLVENWNDKGIQFRSNFGLINDVRLIKTSGSYTCNYGIFMTFPGPEIPNQVPHCDTISNCYINNVFTQIYWQNDGGNRAERNNTVRDCLLKNGLIGIQSSNTDNMVIKRNKMFNLSTAALYSTSSYTNHHTISYNVIWNSGITYSAGSNYNLYNNIVDGAISLTGTTNPSVINNFYRSSTTAGTDNLDLDITGTSFFVDYANKDFHLTSSATLAIDQGTNLGLTEDYDGNIVPVGLAPDIGAFEYDQTFAFANYFVATDGNDSNPGTYYLPFATWHKAFETVIAGELVYIRGGIYNATPANSYSSAYAVYLSGKNGSSGNLIRVFAYPGEIPILNISGLTSTAVDNYGIYMTGCNYWYIKGLNITGASQHDNPVGCGGIRLVSCNNNTLELLRTYGNEGVGIYIAASSEGNLIWHCDSFNNYDPHFTIPGGNADGIDVASITSRLGNPRINTIRGCRSWYNSDDGFDNWNNAGILYIDSCWAFNNGRDQGDGEGFKLGDASSGESISQRIVTNCLAFHNRDIGFYQNSANILMNLYNNTSYSNDFKEFCFWDFNTAMVFRNNISYGSANAFLSNAVHDHNTWDLAVTVNDADFMSVDSTGVSGSRGINGQLPIINFMKLQTGSDLINVGVDVGLPYQGILPDLGYFEKQ